MSSYYLSYFHFSFGNCSERHDAFSANRNLDFKRIPQKTKFRRNMESIKKKYIFDIKFICYFLMIRKWSEISSLKLFPTKEMSFWNVRVKSLNFNSITPDNTSQKNQDLFRFIPIFLSWKKAIYTFRFSPAKQNI